MSEAEYPKGVVMEIAEDDRLFHYTGTDGLYGILQTGQLWATHFQFLNDAQECLQARKSLEHQLYGSISKKVAALVVNGRISLPPGTDVKSASAEEATNVANIFYEVVFHDSDPFVFSAYLCNRSDTRRFLHGDLQHWATYGQGAGYALQINPHRLKAALVAEAERCAHGGLFCAPVYYSNDDAPPPGLRPSFEVLESVSSKIAEYVSLNLNLEDLKREIEETFLPFVRIVPYIKDSCFEHEREGRITLIRHKNVPEGYRNHLIGFAVRGSFAVPYVALFDGLFLGSETAVERIIVGPHPERQRRRAALEMLLRSRGLQIDVTDSELPYLPRR